MAKYLLPIIVFTTLLSCKESAVNHTSFNPNVIEFQEVPDGVEIDEFVSTSLLKIKNNHPASYFNLVNLLYENEYYNEASYIFYIGNSSFKLYNYSNPNFKKEDKHQFDLISFTYGSEIYDHLHSDLENYSKVVLKCHNWYLENEVHYFNTEKEEMFYKVQLNELYELGTKLRDHPNQYLKEFEAEKKALFG